MIKFNLQLFGGRGSGGSKGGGAGGGAGGQRNTQPQAAPQTQNMSVVKNYTDISYSNAQQLFNAPEGTVIRMNTHVDGDYVGEYTKTASGWVGSQQYKSGFRVPATVKTANGFATQIVGKDIKIVKRR